MEKHIFLFIISVFLLTSCGSNEMKLPDDKNNGSSIEVEENKEDENSQEDTEEQDKKNIKEEEEMEEESSEASKELSKMGEQMIELVNEEREKEGLNKLELDKSLRKIARLKSKDIAENDYFSHTSPTYGTPFEMMEEFDISFKMAAENLAGHNSVKLAHEGLMDSKGHRENILQAELTHIGVGIVEDQKYGYIFTQMFITKR